MGRATARKSRSGAAAGTTPRGARVLTTDGITLHAETHGDGEPLVLIQGLGYATWAAGRQIPALSEHLTVIAFDNRGSGQSDKPDEPTSVEQLADDVLSVIEQLAATPVHVAGHSMGGYVAMMLARRHPHAVRSLVLVSTTCGGNDALGVPESTARAWAEASSSSPEAFARATMPLSFAPGWTEAHPDEFEQLLAARLEHPTPPYAWRHQYEACGRFLREGIDATRVAHRSLVVHGTEDRVVPFANAELLVDRLPSADLVRLDGAGHLPTLERPNDVNTVMIEFLCG